MTSFSLILAAVITVAAVVHLHIATSDAATVLAEGNIMQCTEGNGVTCASSSIQAATMILQLEYGTKSQEFVYTPTLQMFKNYMLSSKFNSTVVDVTVTVSPLALFYAVDPAIGQGWRGLYHYQVTPMILTPTTSVGPYSADMGCIQEYLTDIGLVAAGVPMPAQSGDSSIDNVYPYYTSCAKGYHYKYHFPQRMYTVRIDVSVPLSNGSVLAETVIMQVDPVTGVKEYTKRSPSGLVYAKIISATEIGGAGNTFPLVHDGLFIAKLLNGMTGERTTAYLPTISPETMQYVAPLTADVYSTAGQPQDWVWVPASLNCFTAGCVGAHISEWWAVASKRACSGMRWNNMGPQQQDQSITGGVSETSQGQELYNSFYSQQPYNYYACAGPGAICTSMPPGWIKGNVVETPGFPSNWYFSSLGALFLTGVDTLVGSGLRIVLEVAGDYDGQNATCSLGQITSGFTTWTVTIQNAQNLIITVKNIGSAASDYVITTECDDQSIVEVNEDYEIIQGLINYQSYQVGSVVTGQILGATTNCTMTLWSCEYIPGVPDTYQFYGNWTMAVTVTNGGGGGSSPAAPIAPVVAEATSSFGAGIAIVVVIIVLAVVVAVGILYAKKRGADTHGAAEASREKEEKREDAIKLAGDKGKGSEKTEVLEEVIEKKQANDAAEAAAAAAAHGDQATTVTHTYQSRQTVMTQRAMRERPVAMADAAAGVRYTHLT